MNLPCELVTVICSYLDLSSLAAAAFTCVRWHKIIINSNHLQLLKKDNLLHCDLLRGLRVLASSQFYTHDQKKDVCTSIDDMNELYFRKIAEHEDKSCVVDVFGRLFQGRYMRLTSPVVDSQCTDLVVKEIDQFTACVNNEYINKLIALDYQGNIIIDKRKFAIQADKLINYSTTGYIFTDVAHNLCHITNEGDITTLPPLPR